MKRIKLFTIAGIKVYLHWSFLLLMVWILLMQAASHADMRQDTWAVVAVVAIFVSVVLHEMGHAFVAAHFGIRTRYITLWPLGGMTLVERPASRPIEDIAVGLAGPAVNLFIALLLLPFIKEYIPFWQTTAVIDSVGPSNFFLYLHAVNMMLALFNLLPAFPMDGGRILKGLLGLFLPSQRAANIALITGQVIATALIIAGIFSFNLLWPVIGIYILLVDTAEGQRLHLQAGVKGLKVKDLMVRDYAMHQVSLTIEDAAEALLHSHFPHVIVYDKDSIAGVLDRTVIIMASAENRQHQTLQSLIRQVPFIPDENEPAEGVIEKLLYNENTAFAVTSGGQLTGIISLENVVEYLMIHNTRKMGYLQGAYLQHWTHKLIQNTHH